MQIVFVRHVEGNRLTLVEEEFAALELQGVHFVIGVGHRVAEALADGQVLLADQATVLAAGEHGVINQHDHFAGVHGQAVGRKGVAQEFFGMLGAT